MDVPRKLTPWRSPPPRLPFVPAHNVGFACTRILTIGIAFRSSPAFPDIYIFILLRMNNVQGGASTPVLMNECSPGRKHNRRVIDGEGKKERILCFTQFVYTLTRERGAMPHLRSHLPQHLYNV